MSANVWEEPLLWVDVNKNRTFYITIVYTNRIIMLFKEHFRKNQKFQSFVFWFFKLFTFQYTSIRKY